MNAEEMEKLAHVAGMGTTVGTKGKIGTAYRTTINAALEKGKENCREFVLSTVNSQ